MFPEVVWLDWSQASVRSGWSPELSGLELALSLPHQGLEPPSQELEQPFPAAPCLESALIQESWLTGPALNRFDHSWFLCRYPWFRSEPPLQRPSRLEATPSTLHFGATGSSDYSMA